MKILLVITGLGMGGAERQVCDLADGLSSRGHDVKVAYLLKPVLNSPYSNNVEVVWLGGASTFFSMFRALTNLIKTIKTFKPDIIHSHMFHANILARLTQAFIKSNRVVCTAHSNNEGGAFRMFLYRITESLAHVFTNVSQGAVDDFKRKKATSKNKMIAVHNGIDINYFKFYKNNRDVIREQLSLNNKKVFIAIGRFHEAKDYPNLLRAFKRLSSRYANAHLLIVGDGKLRNDIEAFIVNNSLNDRVTLLGLRNDIPELLSASDIFVLSSAWEGFGLVVAEAMACERVVVATDCGGVAEVTGGEGFLVKPHDDLELTSALSKAISLSDEKAKLIGLSERKRIIEKYSLNAVIDKWLTIYCGVLK